mmetsp:Transcript_1123/g.3342  ORF Transcript_1123/g.3342 Transcript_1123/m.3342 type:complete len:200 (-) Transcript_1123:991-1590(-)
MPEQQPSIQSTVQLHLHSPVRPVHAESDVLHGGEGRQDSAAVGPGAVRLRDRPGPRVGRVPGGRVGRAAQEGHPHPGVPHRRVLPDRPHAAGGQAKGEDARRDLFAARRQQGEGDRPHLRHGVLGRRDERRPDQAVAEVVRVLAGGARRPGPALQRRVLRDGGHYGSRSPRKDGQNDRRAREGVERGRAYQLGPHRELH